MNPTFFIRARMLGVRANSRKISGEQWLSIARSFIASIKLESLSRNKATSRDRACGRVPVEPWFTPDQWKPGSLFVHAGEIGATKVCQHGDVNHSGSGSWHEAALLDASLTVAPSRNPSIVLFPALILLPRQHALRLRKDGLGSLSGKECARQTIL